MDASLLIAKSITVLLLLASLLQGCRSTAPVAPGDSNIAQVIVSRVPGLDYDAFALSLSPQAGTTYTLPRKSYPITDGKLDIKVPVGSYGIVLELLKGSNIIASSETCPAANRVATYNLIPGANNLDIPVCPPQPATGGNPGHDNPNGTMKTFSLIGSQLVDPTGQPFVLRGVNTPHAYYFNESNAALPRIKDLGFNSVRIVWCADNLIRSGRCDQKDIRPLSDLEKALSLIKTQRLVAVLNLQNATGSDNLSDLQKMVEYLTRADVKKLLLAYQDILLINIANEWYGTWDKSANYLDGYRAAVRNLRTAGLPHVLLVDARGFGQDASSVIENGKDLASLDPNLMISAHLYDVFSSPDSVANLFASVRSMKLPFVVGEFSCSHGSQKPVACETIMAEATRSGSQYGYIGWSFSGNSSYLKDLDIVDINDWSTLSPWGRTLIHGPSGVKSTAKEACFFRAPHSCSN